MFSPSPHVPIIHLPNVSHNPFLPHQPTLNMNIGADMRRHAAALTKRRARREQEDENQDQDEVYSDDDWDYVHHQDSDHDMNVRSLPDHNYREGDRRARRDLREDVLPRREQDDLEIAHLERAVLEANRALEDAKWNLREAMLRRRERRYEERQQFEEQNHANRSAPEFVRPFVDDVYEKASQQSMRNYLSPAGNKSRPPTPQPSSSSLPPRSRSPSPYRFSSRTESTQPSQSTDETQPRSRTPDPTAHKEKGDNTASATQEQVYQSFNKLHDLSKEFQALKQKFIYPSVIEFQKPDSQIGEVITVRARSFPAEFEDDESMSISDGTGYDSGSEARGSEGKLAYTRANEALHAYTNAMEKLLGQLDSVDSWNETSVRTKRRGIVGDIEQEASKLERYRQKVWRGHLAQENVKVHRS